MQLDAFVVMTGTKVEAVFTEVEGLTAAEDRAKVFAGNRAISGQDELQTDALRDAVWVARVLLNPA